MSRTPQEIKDQEFQVKFRGFDPIEVRSYLDELADDFFALKEQVHIVEEERDALVEKNHELGESCESLQEEKQSLAEELAKGGNNVAQIEEKVEKGYRYKDEQIAELTATKETLVQEKADLQTQVQDAETTQKDLEEKLASRDELIAKEQAESSALRAKIEFLEEQMAELKKEGLDFKSTILVAQQFAEDLKAKASAEAVELVEVAEREADALREETALQRTELQTEITRLGRVHEEVREDLSAKLHLVLDSLTILEVPAGLNESEPIASVSNALEEPAEDDVLDEVNSFFDDAEAEESHPLS